MKAGDNLKFKTPTQNPPKTKMTINLSDGSVVELTSEIKMSQGFWPEGTTSLDLQNYLDEALDKLQKEGQYIGHLKSLDVTLSNGITVRVGGNTKSGVLKVGQFYPVNGPGVETLHLLEMETIQKLLLK